MSVRVAVTATVVYGIVKLPPIALDADVDTLAAMLIGTTHLLFADRKSAPPEAGAIRKVVTMVLAGQMRP